MYMVLRISCGSIQKFMCIDIVIKEPAVRSHDTSYIIIIYTRYFIELNHRDQNLSVAESYISQWENILLAKDIAHP